MTQPRPIAVQLYSVREEMTENWEETLEKISDIGYIGVETAGFGFSNSVKEVKQKLDALDLQVCSMHSPLPLGENHKQVFETAARLGCDRIIPGSTGHDKFSSEADIRQQAELFNQAHKAAQSQGLQFGLHNHWWEFNDINGRLAFDILLEQLDSNIFFEIDAYWAQTAGQDAAALIASLGNRVPLLHVKDGPATIEADMVAVGTGRVDYNQIIPAAEAAEWLIVELDRCATDMITAVADSYSYLTQNGLARGKK